MNDVVATPKRRAESPPHPRGRLAQCFQEAFTVTVRIRADRQATTDPEVFRRHVKQLLLAADEKARGLGYSADDVRLATYACVAFIDESVLSSSQSMFSGWARQPLQEEIFEHHTAGEIFFDNLRALLTSPESPALADLLEVYLLCLLLGFAGRFGADSPELRNLVSESTEKIERVRGETGSLSPGWAPPAQEIAAATDPWIRRLGVAAAGTAVFALVLFLAYRILLSRRVDDVIAMIQGIGS